MSIRETLTRNTTFNAAGRLWEAATALVLAPYIVHRIGLPAYGVWALVSVFIGYVALLDVGMGSGFVKFIAEHVARKEYDGAAAVVSTGFFFYLALGCVLVAVGWPCIDFLLDLLVRLRGGEPIDPQFVDDTRFVFRWALVLFAAGNCIGAFTSIQSGLQRMGITNLIGFGASLIKIAGIVAFLEAGQGIRGLLYADAVAFMGFSAASIATAMWLMRGLRLSPRAMRKGTFGKLAGFGLRTQVAKLSNLVMFQTDMVVAGILFRGFGVVGLYKIGIELANKMRQIPLLLVTALLPAAADLDARDDKRSLRRLYLLATKYTSALAVPLAAYTVGAAGPLMRTWMGPGFETAAWVLRIIAFGYIANILPGPGVSIALGKGRADLQMYGGLISAGANVVLTIALVCLIGLWSRDAAFWGIPIGTALSMFLSFAWFMMVARPILYVGPGEFLRTALVWPSLAALPGFCVCVAADWLTGDLVGRAANGAVVLGTGAAFAAAYLILIRLTPFLDAFDVEFLEDTLHMGRIPLFRAWSRRVRRTGQGQLHDG